MLATIGHMEERVEYWRMVSVISHYSLLPHYDPKHHGKLAPEKLVKLPGQKEIKEPIRFAKVWRTGESEPNE